MTLIHIFSRNLQLSPGMYSIQFRFVPPLETPSRSSLLEHYHPSIISDNDRKQLDQEFALFISSFVSELNDLRDFLMLIDVKKSVFLPWKLHLIEILSYLFDVSFKYVRLILYSLSFGYVTEITSILSDSAKYAK